MGQCALFWVLFALLVGVAFVVWLKSPRPSPMPAGEAPETNPNGKVRRIILYLVGFVALMDLYFYFRDGKPSNLFFALAMIVYLVYSYIYAKRPPSRSVEALALLAILVFGAVSFYLSICLGL